MKKFAQGDDQVNTKYNCMTSLGNLAQNAYKFSDVFVERQKHQKQKYEPPISINAANKF